YGEHRKITLQNGVNPNLNASVREAYFGALPEIRIKMKNTTSISQITANAISVYPNPFTDYIVVEVAGGGEKAELYDLSGKAILNISLQTGSNRINTASLTRGIYILKYGKEVVKLVK
ncbi:MAG: T9SS type A sorting domain-containing protein, partial [Dysgonamonadaceae bacterium]|nr:T9SS type A sorting domain-containing protein [Dysgonamonadaceae bacterium]